MLRTGLSIQLGKFGRTYDGHTRPRIDRLQISGDELGILRERNAPLRCACVVVVVFVVVVVVAFVLFQAALLKLRRRCRTPVWKDGQLLLLLLLVLLLMGFYFRQRRQQFRRRVVGTHFVQNFRGNRGRWLNWLLLLRLRLLLLLLVHCQRRNGRR